MIDFWFGPPGSSADGKKRQEWFQKDPEFDRQIQTRFLWLYQQGVDGELNSWQETPRGCLALILLFDQFPRNMFRGQPQAFATDAQALGVAQGAIAQGFDQALPPVQRQFCYFPFEHSENLAHQHQAVELFAALKDHPETADCYDYALRHRAIIEQFGRFPHRNSILGRETTPAETKFLTQPGSSF